MAKRSASRAVSPVVGTILMVAITMVLAAVLYLMVSGMMDQIYSEMDDETIDISGVVVEKSEEPEYWIIVENEEDGKNYTIESKAFWLGYDIDDNFNEKDISMDIVEKT